jgi:hypothetical protein
MKRKNPENALIFAMWTCLVMGLVDVGFSLDYYFKHKKIISVNWNNADSITIWAQNQLLHMANNVFFWTGILFLSVGFLIWNYRRKIKHLKDSN